MKKVIVLLAFSMMVTGCTREAITYDQYGQPYVQQVPDNDGTAAAIAGAAILGAVIGGVVINNNQHHQNYNQGYRQQNYQNYQGYRQQNYGGQQWQGRR